MKYSIIPSPVRYDEKENETVSFSPLTAVHCVREFLEAGNELSRYLHTRSDADENEIVISKAKSIAPEGYAMYSEFGNLVIKASTVKGAYYAVTTLKWMLMQVKKQEGKKTLTGFLIEDKPDCTHRGMMLDSCRHFFDAETVKRLIDNMAMLKMNYFHWHLADDQGFRIESREFPLLNEIGSKRRYESLSPAKHKKDSVEYGPFFYSQEELKNIVSYAGERFIEIIPEIDIPGHTAAMVASYPELSCDGAETEVAVLGGIKKDILCVSKEGTYKFLEKLFDEICPLFPCRYFHIGGDEVKYEKWEKCPDCQALMKKKGYGNPKELQVIFMNRAAELLNAHGKTCIAWNDCLSDKLDSKVVCQYWIKKNRGEIKRQAAKRDFILSPMMHFYFDMKYCVNSTKKIYKFSRKKAGFGKKEARVRGCEAELWTEWIDNEKSLEYSVYPRIAAVAEAAWKKYEERNYKDFCRRMKFYRLYLKTKNINYYIPEKSFIPLSPVVYSFGKNGREFRRNEKIRQKYKK